MNGSRLLDSNIVVDLFRGDEKTIQKLKTVKNIYIPVIALGELYYGANKSNRTEKRILEIEILERSITLLEVGKKTARIYGEVKDKLRIKGKMIPENDIWIATIAKNMSLR